MKRNGGRILIVEDEPSLADAVRYGLEREGFVCAVATDGEVGLTRYTAEKPDLVILDLMLPGTSGEEICRTIRARDPMTPIIIVSAKDSEVDRILGLELGADDYVTKPFSTRELAARVRTVLRRNRHGRAPQVDRLEVGPVLLDVDRHEVRVDGRIVDMPPKEFQLLESLMRRAGRLCTRDQLIGDVWGPSYFGDTRTLDVHIKRLRTKIEPDPGNPRHLVTMRGLGYKFEAD